MNLKKKKNKLVKPNVIPILDAVFIFIFFLLMSAQFLEIYEIGSDAPAVKTLTTEQKDKKIPLNLTLVITKNQLSIQTGVPSKTIKNIKAINGEYDLESLNSELVKLKSKHLEENSIIIKPRDDIEYKKIVWIMDSVRAVNNKEGEISLVNNGETKKISTLFDQVIFETII